MCIRDSSVVNANEPEKDGGRDLAYGLYVLARNGAAPIGDCLLYTSDAADERSSVDLGGSRIIKKKTTEHYLAAGEAIRHSETHHNTSTHT